MNISYCRAFSPFKTLPGCRVFRQCVIKSKVIRFLTQKSSFSCMSAFGTQSAFCTRRFASMWIVKTQTWTFQSSRNCFKYSEKQIGFSHGNLYNLHLLSNSSPPKMWLSTRNRIFSSTLIPLWWSKFFRTSISITWSRGKMRWYRYTYTYNLGQYKMEQLSPIPPKSNDEGAKEQKRAIFGIIEMREGVVQMFHLFCPRLYTGFQRDKTMGASN